MALRDFILHLTKDLAHWVHLANEKGILLMTGFILRLKKPLQQRKEDSSFKFESEEKRESARPAYDPQTEPNCSQSQSRFYYVSKKRYYKNKIQKDKRNGKNL